MTGFEAHIRSSIKIGDTFFTILETVCFILFTSRGTVFIACRRVSIIKIKSLLMVRKASPEPFQFYLHLQHYKNASKLGNTLNLNQ